MKKFMKLPALFVFLFTTVFISCETEPVDSVLLENLGEEPGTAGPAVFKVDFSGDTYVATSSAAVAANGAIVITGLKGSNGQSVTLSVNGTGTGNYNTALMTYSTGGVSQYFYTNSNPASTNSIPTGSVNITSVNTANNTISGTFNFTGYWSEVAANLPSISFTNGVFTNIPISGLTNPGTEPGTSTGDYFPFAINNQWTFKQDGELNDPIKIVATQSVNGKTYYKVNYFFSSTGSAETDGIATQLFRKEGSDYIQRISLKMPAMEGMTITVSPVEYVFLKDNLNAGQTWTYSTLQVTSYDMPDSPIPLPDVKMKITIDGKVTEKNTTATVNGVTYNDVMKVIVKQTALIVEVPGEFPPTISTSEIWFAKNIGPIKAIITSEGSVSTQELDSHTVN